MTQTEERCRKALLIAELVNEYAKPITYWDKNFNESVNYDVKFVRNICEFFGMKIEQLSNFKKEGERKGYQAFSKEYLGYIKINGCLIKNVPKEYITQELCELAVKQNGVALKWVPEELKTFELCNIAVTNDFTGNALKYVPEEFKTYELCKVALANKWVAK